MSAPDLVSEILRLKKKRNAVILAHNYQDKAIQEIADFVGDSLGLAYKANVDDDRESPSYVLMDLLKASGAELSYYDPYVPVIKPTREHPHWAGTKSVSWNRESIESFDAVLISTAHANVDYQQLVQWSQLIIDTRNATRPWQPNPKIIQA